MIAKGLFPRLPARLPRRKFYLLSLWFSCVHSLIFGRFLQCMILTEFVICKLGRSKIPRLPARDTPLVWPRKVSLVRWRRPFRDDEDTGMVDGERVELRPSCYPVLLRVPPLLQICAEYRCEYCCDSSSTLKGRSKRQRRARLTTLPSCKAASRVVQYVVSSDEESLRNLCSPRFLLLRRPSLGASVEGPNLAESSSSRKGWAAASGSGVAHGAPPVDPAEAAACTTEGIGRWAPFSPLAAEEKLVSLRKIRLLREQLSASQESLAARLEVERLTEDAKEKAEREAADFATSWPRMKSF
ncbi:hypothetical protein LWI29_034036 [Acer saccharum]|uniref:Uncharacterized protein n=1 Tax=Acer saccharum TaxID=4024 RepID=A0AA39RS02_ACESA|nr:hypothetical protein LWI29_034036 [Acer saccharum]